MTTGVSYRILFSDYQAMCKIMSDKRKYSRLRESVYWLILAANLLIPVWLFSTLPREELFANWEILLLPNIIVAIILMLWRFAFVTLFQRNYYKRQEIGEKDIWLEIDETGLKMKLPNIDAEYQWEAIQCIDQTYQHVFFWINKLQAIILPLRVFKNKRKCDEFIAQIQFPVSEG